MARGTVEDDVGDEQRFVMQSVSEDVPVTGANTYWLTAMGLLTIAAGLIIIEDPRLLKRRA